MITGTIGAGRLRFLGVVRWRSQLPQVKNFQHNAQPRCGPHNRFKHKQRWQSKRDQRGRPYNIKPDGTIVLPVGEREPDLTHDEVNELARQRLHTLRTT